MARRKHPAVASLEGVLPQRVARSIRVVREQKVLLDEDLAELYGVSTKLLLQSVRRNQHRFPEDFAFQLSQEEVEALRSQIVTSKVAGRGGRRYVPIVFTEQGVAMLSSVLRGPRAVRVNIAIMRAFVQLRQFVASNEGLVRRLAGLEKRYDASFHAVFTALRRLVGPAQPPAPRRRIGFDAGGEPQKPVSRRVARPRR